MSYDRIFDHHPDLDRRSAAPAPIRALDRTLEGTYEYDVEGKIELHVNVALASGRPLIVRGPPGCGKSSLARDIASNLRWNYLEHVVTSRDQAQDIQWRFDAIHRLRDAQAQGDVDAQRYVRPGVLWWAFHPESARWAGEHQAWQDAPAWPIVYPGVDRGADRTVVLIDEIDKADPDVPNDLLEALGSQSFTVAETGFAVRGDAGPFVLITTNRERHLPQAFLRRCISLQLEVPSETWMLRIAESHFPESSDQDRRTVYLRFARLRDAAVGSGVRPPGTAEFLDALRAYGQLRPGDEQLTNQLLDATLWKDVTEPSPTAPDS